MKINFNAENNSDRPFDQVQYILSLVRDAFETSPFPSDSGFRFLQDVALGDYYETLVFISNNQLHAKVCRWVKREDYSLFGDPLQRFHLQGIFTPTLIQKEMILSDEERDYFSGFLKKLLVEPEGQILEPTGGILLDGSNYVLQLFNEGKMERIFRWNDSVKARGLMEQLIKLTNHTHSVHEK